MSKLKSLAQSLEGLSQFLDELSIQYNNWPMDRLLEFANQSHEAYKAALALKDLTEYLEK